MEELRNEVRAELDEKYQLEIDELYFKLKKAGDQLAITRRQISETEQECVSMEAELNVKRHRMKRLETRLDHEIKYHVEAQREFQRIVGKCRDMHVQSIALLFCNLNFTPRKHKFTHIDFSRR